MKLFKSLIEKSMLVILRHEESVFRKRYFLRQHDKGERFK